MRITRTAVLLAVCLLVPALGIQAAQLLVSQDGTAQYRSIQAAVDAASHGDTIYVSPGIYEEHVTLKDGLTVIGAGSHRTIIRNTYGFDEAVTARNVSTGRLEGVTVERGASVLAAPSVVLEDASLSVVDCVIRGAQESGTVVRGTASRPSFVRVQIVENALHGIVAEEHSVVRLTDCTIKENQGSGLVVRDEARIECVDGTVSENRYSGVVIENDAEVTLTRTAIEENDAWGLVAIDRAHLVAHDVQLVSNRDGGVWARSRALVEIQGARFVGGSLGLLAEGATELYVERSAIHATTDDGIRLLDATAGSISRVEIVQAGNHGLHNDSGQLVDCAHLTIAKSGADGARLSGASTRLVSSILVLNRGAGIRVTSPQSETELTHNNVWGNEETNYEGITPRPTDRSEPPDFANLGALDVRLLPDSPGVEDGPGGICIGAHEAPNDAPGTRIMLELRDGDLISWLEAEVSAAFDPLTPAFGGAEAHLELGEHDMSVGFGTRLSETWGWRNQVAAQLLLENRFGPVTAALQLRATGWTDSGFPDPVVTVQGEGRFLIGTADLRLSHSAEWPTGDTKQHGNLRLGDSVYGELDAAARNWRPTDLRIGGGVRADLSVGVARLSAEFHAGRSVSWSGAWSFGHRRLDVDGVSYLDAPNTHRVSARWREGDTLRVEVAPWLRIESGRFAGAGLETSARFAALTVGVGFGLITERGPHLRLTLSADLGALTREPANQPPDAVATLEPTDVETGQTVQFDATGSSDPEGMIQAIWWDFGDGALAEGWTVDHAYATPGTFLVTLMVTDAAGETGMTTHTLTVWPADTRPNPSFVWSPASPRGTPLSRPLREGDAVRFDASSSFDKDGHIVEFAWDLDSDGIVEHVGSEPQWISDPLDVGDHPVTLRALDDSGRWRSVLRVLTVQLAEPPVAAFHVTPASPSILDTVVFTDQSTDTDGTIEYWAWDFGDGHTAREPNPTHRYATSGTFEVSLRVGDDTGLESIAQQTIHVSLTPEVTPYENIWALVIGISDYREVEDLKYGSLDAEAMASWLLDNGVPAGHIRLLTDRHLVDREDLRSDEATLVAVREALGWLRRMAGPTDLVVIHFSGHGFQGIDDDGDEADGVDEFLVLSDTREAAKEDTALRDDEFGRFLDRIESQHVVVFFDSCYSGGHSRSLSSGARPSGGHTDLLRDFAMEGRLVFSAAAEAQEAFESDVLQHGVFSHFLLRGLNGEADSNGDEHISAWELYTYVSREVPPYVLREKQAEQTPQLLGEGDTRILVSPAPRPTAGLSYAPHAPYAGGTIQFRDETTDPGVVATSWDFGDGIRVDARHPTHTYDAPGAFTVQMTHTLDSGQTASHKVELRIASPGRVEGIDPDAGTAVINLGARNGLTIGDRFSTLDEDGRATGQLTVVELLDRDGALCRIETGADAILPGQTIRAL